MKVSIILPSAVIIFMAVVVGAMVNKGAETLDLFGGERGAVSFPHHAHQTILGDCNTCHALFPQKLGSIQELIQAGELKKKQVMNGHCKKCHREMKKAGEKTGPTACSKCHHK